MRRNKVAGKMGQSLGMTQQSMPRVLSGQTATHSRIGTMGPQALRPQRPGRNTESMFQPKILPRPVAQGHLAPSHERPSRN